MVEKIGFEGPAVVDGEVKEYSFEGEETTVLAFFPGAFTGVCTEEMCELRDSMKEFEELGAEVIGISVDTPFALQEFADKNQLEFKLVSDTDAEIAEAYGVKAGFPDPEYTIAQRAVFIVSEGEVVYSEVLEDPGNLPNMEKLKEKLAEL